MIVGFLRRVSEQLARGEGHSPDPSGVVGDVNFAVAITMHSDCTGLCQWAYAGLRHTARQESVYSRDRFIPVGVFSRDAQTRDPHPGLWDQTPCGTELAMHLPQRGSIV